MSLNVNWHTEENAGNEYLDLFPVYFKVMDEKVDSNSRWKSLIKHIGVKSLNKT